MSTSTTPAELFASSLDQPTLNEDTESYVAVRAGHQLLTDYDQDPATSNWPPVADLLSEIETAALRKHPEIEPELVPVAVATWNEIRTRIAAQKAQVGTANPFSASTQQ